MFLYSVQSPHRASSNPTTMVRICAIFVPFLFVVASVSVTMASADDLAKESNTQAQITILTPKEMDEFLKENPNAVPLERRVAKKRTAGNSLFQTADHIIYTLGYRVGGDDWVSREYGNQDYGSPQNIILSARYPRNGDGAIVSYVEMHIYQSGNEGRAYCNEGGIGQRRIGFVVESYNTWYFHHDLWFFGLY